MRPVRNALGFECSELVKVDGLVDRSIGGLALSQFGLLAVCACGGGGVHFHDLVGGSHFVIGGLRYYIRAV